MSNLETAPAEVACAASQLNGPEVLRPREVPLGGPRAIRVRRTLPHDAPAPVALRGAVARVFLGQFAGSRSPVHTFTPLLGAQIDLEAGARVTLDLDPAFEHGVLRDQGTVAMDGIALNVADLGYQGPGCSSLFLYNGGDRRARVLLLGGMPFREQLVMWWNFVGRSHDEIVSYRALWQDADGRFGAVHGYRGTPARLPAPALPSTPLRPRPLPDTPRRKELS